MKDKLGQEPAYPVVLDGLKHNSRVDCGLSTRLLLSGMAMQGLMANTTFSTAGYDEIARWSLEQVDELLRQEAL